MFSAVEAPVSIIRVCGHREVEEMRYRSRAHRQQLEDSARKCFCAECEAKVVSWLNAAEGQPYPLELPQLIGSPSQISWAHSLRAKVAGPMLRAMNLAVAHGGKTGAAVWQALYALLSQRQARFWIDGRVAGYSESFILSEASYFAMGVTFGVNFGERSIFGHWKKRSPCLIDDVRSRCPVSVTPANAQPSIN